MQASCDRFAPRRAVCVALLAMTCVCGFAPRAEARRYRAGDSVEITADITLALCKEPGAAEDEATALALGADNTFDVQEARVLDGERWLMIKAFRKTVEKGIDRYAELGRGWVRASALENAGRREDSAWTSHMASAAPPAAPGNVAPPAPAPPTPPVAAAPQSGARRTLTQEECDKVAVLFKKVGASIREASAALQGDTVVLTVKYADGASDEQVRALSEGFVSLFKDYDYAFRVDVMGPSNQRAYSGKRPRGATAIAW